MSDPIDRIVKGVPPPDVSAEQVAANAKASSASPANSVTAPQPSIASGSDPRDALPSSPPQIYLNLLILESSLRLQYISLRARLRLHLLLLIVLMVWNAAFTYLLFLRPREDGSGIGGSVYWVVEVTEKVCWCSGVVTLCLFWGTGMYERGVRWPRKFVSTTNRGLRGFNLKVVVVRGSVLSEIAGWIAMLDQMGWFREDRVNFQYVPKDVEAGTAPTKDPWNTHVHRHGVAEEDIAPGGDVLRVLLLPKPFSPDFREGWDTFRMAYWERENARRASLRILVKARKHEIAKKNGGWLWWTGWRGWHNFKPSSLLRARSRRQLELEKLDIKEKPSIEKGKERRRKDTLVRDGSHSRNSSHSRPSTPDIEAKPSRRERRGSSTHSTGAAGSGRLRKPPVNEKSRLSATETLLHNSNDLLPMTKRNSAAGTGSFDDGFKKEEDTEHHIKQEPTFMSEIKVEPAEA